MSVLICTHDRRDLLNHALWALIEGTDEKPDQVVVVNGGDERANLVVHSFMGRHNIKVKLVNTVNKNPAASRNVGLSYCSGDIVAMTDDDAEVFPDWVTEMKRVHAEHPEAGAVGGAIVGSHSHTGLLSRLADLVTFVSPLEPGYVRTLPGVNVSYKRVVVDQVGSQDETLFCGEDVDFNWRVKRLDYQVYYDPLIKVIHHHRPKLRQFLVQHYMYGRAYYLVRSKWPDMYCVYPHKVHSLKDFLRFGHFFLAILYQPFQFAVKLRRPLDRVFALPILVALQVIWKAGMVLQMLYERSR